MIFQNIYFRYWKSLKFMQMLCSETRNNQIETERVWNENIVK